MQVHDYHVGLRGGGLGGVGAVAASATTSTVPMAGNLQGCCQAWPVRAVSVRSSHHCFWSRRRSSPASVRCPIGRKARKCR
jgi:hypothetical protein